MAKGLLGLLDHHFGKRKRDLERLRPHVAKVKQAAERLRNVSDEELVGMRAVFRERHAAGESLDDLLPEAFGVVWEGCRRLAERRASWLVWGHEQTWDMVPYDVQIIGAVALHEGKIAEMATGEGKTLVAIMPLYLNSIPGKGAHLVTVNDYLARRDAEWMGGVLKFLGCNVAFITHDMTPDQRREAYGAEITYGTNNEFGFDYLRDNMSVHPSQLVQRGFFYAIVDEVDSVLIDEARTPLIISGAVDKSTHRFNELQPRVKKLVDQQMKIVTNWIADCERALKRGRRRRERRDRRRDRASSSCASAAARPKNKRYRRLAHIPGVLEVVQRTEEAYMRDKAMWEADEDLLYVVEEKHHNIDLTEKGREVLSADEHDFFVLPDLAEASSRDRGRRLARPPSSGPRSSRRSSASTRARTSRSATSTSSCGPTPCTRRTTSTSIQDGKIVIVDEFTGRLMPGRRFSEGLHQALEAKEGVTVEKETQTLATVTIQNFFRMYEKLVRHDRHGGDRGGGVPLDLQARRRRHPDQPAGRAAPSTTTSST